MPSKKVSQVIQSQRGSLLISDHLLLATYTAIFTLLVTSVRSLLTISASLDGYHCTSHANRPVGDQVETVAEASLAGKVGVARSSGPKIQTPQSCPTHRNDIGVGARGE